MPVNDHDLLIRIDERLQTVERKGEKAEGRGWQDMAFRLAVLILSVVTVSDKTGVELGIQDAAQNGVGAIIRFLNI